MKRSVFVLAAGAAIVAGSILAALQAQGGQGAPAQPMGFFVTSVGLEGGNLGGLQGADAHCQKLAAASGREGAGNRVWRAYLSTRARTPSTPAIALDRARGPTHAAASSRATSRTCTAIPSSLRSSAATSRRQRR